MIEEIRIANTASYSPAGQTLSNLDAVNFIYGSNATGKTTISKIIDEPDENSECKVCWKNGTALETLVYNTDFVEANFNQVDQLKGIFTLGEKDKEVYELITKNRSDFEERQKNIDKLNALLNGNDSITGKTQELKKVESEFEDDCWKIKVNLDEKFESAFVRFRGSKDKFKTKLLQEANSNQAQTLPIEDLERKAQSIFKKDPQPETPITIPEFENLISLEKDQILKKVIIGKSDVDIAALIDHVKNSDWVKQGREYLKQTDGICPFCQQSIGESLEKSLASYFDDAFATDISAVDNLLSEYSSESQQLTQELTGILDSLETVLERHPTLLDLNNFRLLCSNLETSFSNNIQKIREKQKEPSKVVTVISLETTYTQIKELLTNVNSAITNHNNMVLNLKSEKSLLISQIWRHILDKEIKSKLADYNKNKSVLDAAINSIKTQIANYISQKISIKEKIRDLERRITSVQPTIDNINLYLKSFDFYNFFLAKSELGNYYEIKRDDGSDGKRTLSEGEKGFIMFLYFYSLIKGSHAESGAISDRIVVFDDPVSSFDCNVLFIVSTMIRDIIKEVRENTGNIKQVFVLSHNVFFFKEVTYKSKKQKNSKDTFWIVSKRNRESVIQHYDTNPVKTAYELLWMEVKNPDRDSIALQNAMRRILEYYFKILGNQNFDDICNNFTGKDKIICQSLLSWAHQGSHTPFDDLTISMDENMIDLNLKVFKEIFEKNRHIEHYNMMITSES